MTGKERFEREQIEKERKEVEEEDHQEDVSFQDNFIHLKNIMFTVVFFSAAYQVHKAILRKQEERKARFEGRAPVVDINAPEYQKNLSEE